MTTSRENDITTKLPMKRASNSFQLPIPLDGESRIPVYRQLYGWIRDAILAGTLRTGQRLPSTRALAVHLRLSRIPVLSAYEQLLAEGYLETFVGAGTCVARQLPQQEASRPATLKPDRPLPRPAGPAA